MITQIHQNESNTIQNYILTILVKTSFCTVQKSCFRIKCTSDPTLVKSKWIYKIQVWNFCNLNKSFVKFLKFNFQQLKCWTKCKSQYNYDQPYDYQIGNEMDVYGTIVEMNLWHWSIFILNPSIWHNSMFLFKKW